MAAFDVVPSNLDRAVDLASDWHEAYLRATDRARRLLNQAIFEKLHIDSDELVRSEFAEPFDILLGETVVRTVVDRIDRAVLTTVESESIDKAWQRFSQRWTAEIIADRRLINDRTPVTLNVVGVSYMDLMVDLQRQLSSLSPMLNRFLERPLSRTSSPPRQPRQLQLAHRLTSLEQAELVRHYEAGESVTALKQAYSINRETVLLHLKRAGVTRTPSLRKMNNDEVQQAAALYIDGLSLLRTAEKFGVSERTMRRELADAGYAIRPRKGW